MRGDSYLPVLFMKEIIRKEYGYEKKWIKNGIAAAAIFMAMALAGCKNTDQGSGSSQSVQSESAQDQAGQTENAEKDSVIVVMGPSSECRKMSGPR